MIRFTRPLLSVFALLAISLPAAAQSSGATVTELVLERQLALSSTFSSTDLALPDNLSQGILSGALEVRERFIYNPSGSSLTSSIFAVQAGSPMPTPLNTNLNGQVLGVYQLGIEKIYLTTKPQNSISFTGTVAGSSSGGVLGNVFGLPFTVSLGFNNDTPTKANDLVHVIAGRVVAYSKDAAGTLVVPRAPTPPVNPTGPQIVVSLPSNTVSKQINLDASQTTDDSGTSLTFVWRNVNKSAVLLNPNTAIATVQFSEGPGDYTFEVTVTNGLGQTAKKQATTTYLGR